MKIRNEQAGYYATRTQMFKGSNLYSTRKWGNAPGGVGGQMYTVFSYNYRWPLYIFFNGLWYENGDYSTRTTSKHREQARPTGVDIKVTTRAKMLALYQEYIIPRDPGIVEQMFA